MDKNIKDILQTFESISNSKKNLSEASEFSGDLFGGKSVKIPVDGAHKGQSGWASSDAWDIPAGIGTDVFAITSGQVVTFNDYGPSIRKTQGKKLYGIGFTVKGDGDQPDVYYTHLKNVKVKKGDKVQCGQLLGQVMDMPNSSYDHVHIGVSNDVNIRKLIGTNGKIKCGKPGSMKKVDVGQEILDLIFGKSSSDSVESRIGSALSSLIGLTESILDVQQYAKSIGWSGYDNLRTDISKEFAKSFNAYMYEVEKLDSGKKCDRKINFISSSQNSITFEVTFDNNCKENFFPTSSKNVRISKNGNQYTAYPLQQKGYIPQEGSDEFDPDEGAQQLPDILDKGLQSNKLVQRANKLFAAGAAAVKNKPLKEENVFSSFGNKSKTTGNIQFIPKEKNEKIFSPVEGFVNNTKAAYGCKNSITIEFEIDGDPHFLRYCGITEPKVSDGQKVTRGTLLGKNSDDVQVLLFNKFYGQEKIGDYKNKEVKSKTEPYREPKQKQSPVKRTKSKEKKVKQDYEYELDDKRKQPFDYHNPLIGSAVDLVLAPFTNKWTWPTEKKQPKPGSFFKSKKLKEETERIKKLLK